VNDVLKAIRFQKPDRIPVNFDFNGSVWAHYDHDALQDLMEAHPYLFPDFKRQEKVQPHYQPWQRADHPWTDVWGCVWETAEDGITGTVTKHPLETWDDFENYTPPDPAETDGRKPVDWQKEEAAFRRKKEHNGIAGAGLYHGHTFLRLVDIRGYENLLFDMADGEIRLDALVEMVEAVNLEVLRRKVSWGPDWVGYPEDLGMQIGPMLSPEHLRRYIKPCYEKMMAIARDAGLPVHMHSDGDIRDLLPDLLSAGVECINLQDLVNGIDWIRDNLRGRVCIDLDVDRQKVVRFGTPREIDELVLREVRELGSPEGGLMLRVDMYYGMPLENIEALMDALEKYSLYYS
jgi:hypothetical protein